MPGVSEKQFKDLNGRLDRIIKTLEKAEEMAYERSDMRLDGHREELRAAISHVARAKQMLVDMYREIVEK